MNTIPEQTAGGRRRRLRRSDDFKADAVAACTQPGVSMAAVAMSLGVNANLLRRWVRDAELGQTKLATTPRVPNTAAAATAAFMPVQIPAPTPAAGDIRVELRRGPTTIIVAWPTGAAGECAAWMRELLR